MDWASLGLGSRPAIWPGIVVSEALYIDLLAVSSPQGKALQCDSLGADFSYLEGCTVHGAWELGLVFEPTFHSVSWVYS